METVSTKALWTLVSGEGLKTDKGIIETELLGQDSLLREGLLSYRANTPESLVKFKKNLEVGESWKDFVIRLAGLARIEEGQAWELLCNYLATEFRGTSDSLAQLLKDEAQASSIGRSGSISSKYSRTSSPSSTTRRTLTRPCSSRCLT
jgi:hypothetical protein